MGETLPPNPSSLLDGGGSTYLMCRHGRGGGVVPKIIERRFNEEQLMVNMEDIIEKAGKL